MDLIADGLGNKDIAARLNISEQVVKNNIRSVRRCLGLPVSSKCRVMIANAVKQRRGEFHCPPTVTFNSRESEIASFLAAGLSTKEIAGRIGYSEEGLRSNLVRRIFDKTGMDTRAEFAAWYWAHTKPATEASL